MNKLKNITTFSATAALAAAALLHCSCKEKGEVQHFTTPKTTPSTNQSTNQSAEPDTSPNTTPGAMAKTSAPDQAAKSAAPYSWTLPDGWTAKAASGMRLATIVIPAKGNTLNASVTEFGGSLAGNVNRWRGQIGLPPLDEAAILASLVKIETGLGKGYIVSLSNPATPDKALLAAIIPLPSATSVFIKVPGSSTELEQISPAFTRFTQSLGPSSR